MNSCPKVLSTCLLALFASAAFAAEAPPLDTAGPFAVLSGSAVSTTGASITGNVGSAGAVTLTGSTVIGNVVYTSAITTTDSTITGTTTFPLNAQVMVDFEEAYLALNQPCTRTFTEAAFTDAMLTVGSGVTCFPAAVTFTRTTLTLTGNGPWILRVGSEAAGALTGTNLTMVMANGGDSCDVFWQVNAATTLTTSVFRGTILAGAAVTTTGGTIAGQVLARAAVTMTGTTLIGCDDALPGTTACKVKSHKRHKSDKSGKSGKSDKSGKSGKSDKSGKSHRSPWSR